MDRREAIVAGVLGALACMVVPWRQKRSDSRKVRVESDGHCTYSREPIKIDEIRRAFREEAANSDRAFSDAWDGLLEMAKINTDLLSNRESNP